MWNNQLYEVYLKEDMRGRFWYWNWKMSLAGRIFCHVSNKNDKKTEMNGVCQFHAQCIIIQQKSLLFSTLRSERVTLSNQRYLNFHAKKVLKKTHTKLFLNTNAALHVHLHTNISKNSLFCQKKWCGKSWLFIHFMNVLLTQCLSFYHATFHTKMSRVAQIVQMIGLKLGDVWSR